MNKTGASLLVLSAPSSFHPNPTHRHGQGEHPPFTTAKRVGAKLQSMTSRWDPLLRVGFKAPHRRHRALGDVATSPLRSKARTDLWSPSLPGHLYPSALRQPGPGAVQYFSSNVGLPPATTGQASPQA